MKKGQPTRAHARRATQLVQRWHEQQAELRRNPDLVAKFERRDALFEQLCEIRAADLDYEGRLKHTKPVWIELVDLQCELDGLLGNGEVVRKKVEQDLRARLDHHPNSIDRSALLEELARLLDKRDDHRNPPAIRRTAQDEFDQKTGIGDGPAWRSLLEGGNTRLSLAPSDRTDQPRQPDNTTSNKSHGRRPTSKGGRGHMALTHEQQTDARRMRAEGKSRSAVAAHFGCSVRTISKVAPVKKKRVASQFPGPVRRR